MTSFWYIFLMVMNDRVASDTGRYWNILEILETSKILENILENGCFFENILERFQYIFRFHFQYMKILEKIYFNT